MSKSKSEDADDGQLLQGPIAAKGGLMCWMPVTCNAPDGRQRATRLGVDCQLARFVAALRRDVRQSFAPPLAHFFVGASSVVIRAEAATSSCFRASVYLLHQVTTEHDS